LGAHPALDPKKFADPWTSVLIWHRWCDATALPVAVARQTFTSRSNSIRNNSVAWVQHCSSASSSHKYQYQGWQAGLTQAVEWGGAYNKQQGLFQWHGGVAAGRRIRDQEVASSIPGCSAARCNPGQVVRTRVPLFTKQHKLVPASAGE